MFDIPSNALSIIGVVYTFLEYLKKYLRNKKLKDELRRELRKPYCDLQNSLNDCIEKFYTVFGAALLSICGMYPRNDVRKRAEKYVQDLENSIDNLTLSLKRVANLVNTHMESLREVSEPDQQMILDILAKYGEKDGANIDFFLQYPYIQEKLKEKFAIGENRFSKELTRSIRKLNKKLNIDWLEEEIRKKCGLIDIEEIFNAVLELLKESIESS
ncbi:MAG: hypothetical protein FE037_00350 [Thermoplasmata archaeon]|nr:MAG: hypothetical protein FE037_00350 [Thermoplasmata archaeon]